MLILVYSVDLGTTLILLYSTYSNNQHSGDNHQIVILYKIQGNNTMIQNLISQTEIIFVSFLFFYIKVIFNNKKISKNYKFHDLATEK